MADQGKVCDRANMGYQRAGSQSMAEEAEVSERANYGSSSWATESRRGPRTGLDLRIEVSKEAKERSREYLQSKGLLCSPRNETCVDIAKQPVLWSEK